MLEKILKKVKKRGRKTIRIVQDCLSMLEKEEEKTLNKHINRKEERKR